MGISGSASFHRQVAEGVNQRGGGYTERDFFHVNGGSSKLAAFRRYALACSAALSFPCSISSTDSEGAIQFFAFTLYTDACTPRAFSSENSRMCSPPSLTSAQTPCSNIEELLKTEKLPHRFGLPACMRRATPYAALRESCRKLRRWNANPRAETRCARSLVRAV